jgi:hypothetical protein
LRFFGNSRTLPQQVGCIPSMKATTAVKSLAMILLILLCRPEVVQARVANFRADVPFEFVIGKQTLPAAAYVVQVLLGRHPGPEDTGVVVLKTTDGRIYRAEVTRVESGHHVMRSPVSKLLFTRFQGKQYLAQAWMAADAVELEFANPPQASSSPARSSTEIVLARYR